MCHLIRPELYDTLYKEEQYAKYNYLHSVGICVSGTVLDVGCGTGLLLEYISESGGRTYSRYVCLDPDTEMLTIASRKVSNPFVILVEGYAEELPFRDEYFDVVVSITTLGALKDVLSALCELLRVTRINGHVIITGHPRTYSLRPESINEEFHFVGQHIDDFYIAIRHSNLSSSCLST